jgi:DNA-binding beta-propeller fold protein YncE
LSRKFVSVLIVALTTAIAPASALAGTYGALRFFAEPGPPPLGQDPLVGQCFSHSPNDAAIGTGPCRPSNGLNSAYHAKASADGRSVYVASALSDSVTIFSREAESGTLTRAGCVSEGGVDGCAVGRGLQGAIATAVSPDGQNVYVSARTGDAVAVFARDASSGALKQLLGELGCVSEGGVGGCAVAKGLDHAVGIEVSADGKNVYVASRGSDAVAIFTRSPSDGSLTQLSDDAGCIHDSLTSASSRQGCAAGRGLDGAYSITLDRGGEYLYVAARVSDSATAFARNTDGALHQLAGAGGCISHSTLGDCAVAGRGLDGATALALSHDGSSAYVASYASDSLAVLARDPPSGTLFYRGCLSEGTDPGCAGARALDYANAVTVSGDDREVYVAAGYASAVSILQRSVDGSLAQQQPASGRTWSDGCISWRGHRWSRATDLSKPDHSDHYCARTLALYYPYSVEMSPDGNELYVASTLSDSLTVLRRVVASQADAAPPPPTPVSTRDVEPPRLTLAGARYQRLGKRRFLQVIAACDEPCALRALATVRMAHTRLTLRTRTAKRALSRAGRARLRLSFSRRSLRTLRRAIAQPRRPIATASVQARDESGNVASKRLRIRIRR